MLLQQLQEQAEVKLVVIDDDHGLFRGGLHSALKDESDARREEGQFAPCLIRNDT
jgi:hypothetical protein